VTTQSLFRRYITPFFLFIGLLVSLLTTQLTPAFADYPCGTYSSDTYASASATDCPSTTAKSPSSSTSSTSSPTSSQTTTTTPTPNSTTPQTGTNNPREPATQTTSATKSSWNWVPYFIGVVVILVALVAILLIRRKKSQSR
jgi:cobalamin biosynthesis Mg chelatase CobN